MSYPAMPLGFLGSQGGDNDTYPIVRSLRFNTADSAYVSKTYASGTAPTTLTISCWIKRSSLSTVSSIFASRSGFIVTQLEFASDDKLSLVGTNSGGSLTMNIKTSDVFRDVTAWYHLVLSVDTAQATASDRVKIYVNGSQITSFTTSTYPPQNSTYATFGATEHSLGGRLLVPSGVDSYFSGYLTETIGVDGQALTPSSFGETDATTGRWKAKAYSGTYGTNGFYLKFADNSGVTAATLGKDSSPNGNNWTPNNFSVTAGTGNDSLVDSPTNYGTDIGTGGEVRGNYATANFLDQSGCTFTNGLLDVAMSGNGFAISSIGVSSGKWYAEVVVTSANLEMIGICQIDGTVASRQYIGTNGWYYYAANGQKFNVGTGASYGATYTTNDIIGIALNMDSGSVTFYKNGTTQGVAYNSGISGKVIAFAVGRGSSAGSNAVTLNFGQRPFAYTAPTGFKALCTTNLPTPTIKKPSSYFDAVTYTGTGATQSITSLGFSPDLLWTKGRSLAQSNNLFDTLRSGQRLRSDTTGAEVATTVTLGSSGFTLGAESESNNSGSTFVAWAWDAGSSSVTNNSGSITSTVRAEPQSGFSVCTFNVGASGAKTFGHGLSTAPRMVIVKSRTSALGWCTYHASVISATNQYLQINTTATISSVAGLWGSALPTSSVVGVGSGTNVNVNDDCVAYCFAEVEGFSKFGSYTGNGSADGSFVWCGFRPRWILIKATVEASNWLQWDTSRMTFNTMSTYLMPSSANAETTDATYSVDCTSNGFKIRGTGQFGGFNNNGNTYIFAAFAEQPFKYARAR